MVRRFKRRIALAVAVAAVLAGGTAVALGATGALHAHGGHHHARAGARRAGLLATATSYLGIPASQLRGELEAGKTLGQVADATPGRSEAGLIAALLAAAKSRSQGVRPDSASRIEALVRGARLGKHAHAWSRRGLLRTATLAYLGIERKALLKDLHSGRTLAQIADATPGKSATGLREALLTAASKHFEGKLAAHAISSRAEQTRLAHVKAKIETLMNRVLSKAGKHETGTGGHGAKKARRRPHHAHRSTKHAAAAAPAPAL